ncbi:hypothetical protein LguiB_004655 [Lonicera macranthoides]
MYAISLLFLSTTTTLTQIPPTLSSTLLQDLNNLHPPPDFNTTLTKNCHHNPSLKYCNSTPFNLPQIFKFTIVATHLCNDSNNPNCIESFPKIDLKNRPNLAPLYLSFTFFWIYCPLTILSIDLSNNSLNQNFPKEIFYCSQIQSLDLSHNFLHGDVPIKNFSLVPNLTFLNLSYNYFSESKISDTQFFKRFNSSSFLHSSLVPDNKKFRIRAVILLILFPISVIIMVVLLGWLCFFRPDLLPALFRRNHRFTPSILKMATGGFSKRNLVGRSGVVDIYRGELRDGSEARIEIFWESLSRKKRREFVEECRIMVKLEHKNLVKVMGWCDDRKLRAIVAEWVGEESVEMWLLRSNPPWKKRVKVLMGVMEGIRYLQEEWPEVGYDLKTSSVLLSEERDPLISRFRVDAQNSRSKKMVSNKRPREEFERGEAGFLEWVRMNYPENVEKVIDERMKKKANTIEQASEAIDLGLKCTDLSAVPHPSFDQIYIMLSRIYRSCMISTSHVHKRLHEEGKEGHKRRDSRGS